MVTDATKQGRDAFQHNHPMSSCKYPVGSPLREQWMAGWHEAQNAAPRGAGVAHPGMMGDARRAAHLDKPSAHES